VTDQVLLFVDYQNVHWWALRRFYPLGADPATGHIDPLRMGQLIVGKRRRPSELAGVRVYRGRPAPVHQPRAAAANDRQAATWERSAVIDVVRRPLRYPPDWPDTPATEKGIDVALAIDFVRLAHTGAYDVGVLFSADTDLLPALETVYELQLAHVEIATWAGANRLRFGTSQLPWCHFLSQQDYRAVEDPVDYRRRP
jgi:hypothetical protein